MLSSASLGPLSLYRRLFRARSWIRNVARTRAVESAMLDWSQCPAVERTPGKVSGAWLFKGTRVSVKALFENLESGARIDEFLEWFPGVSREQVELVLRDAEQSLEIA